MYKRQDTLYVNTANDRVGINEDNPQKSLDVNGTFRATGAATFDEDLTVDTDTLYVDSTDHMVGIGTTDPKQTLEVSGVFISQYGTSGLSNFGFPHGGSNTLSHDNFHNIGSAIFIKSSEEEHNPTIMLANIFKGTSSNMNRNASIGFALTDSNGRNKYGGQIGFWPGQGANGGDARNQEFRIYTCLLYTSPSPRD